MESSNEQIQAIIDMMIKDQPFRRAMATREPRLFFGTYLSHYVTCPFAYFHFEMFKLQKDPSKKAIVIMAARNSAKSTIMNTSLALWSILGEPQKKMVVILGSTQTSAKKHYVDLRSELEQNKLLRSDLGPFKEKDSPWGSTLELPKYGAHITFASTEQSIRGIKFGPHRPDLFIADDLEDDESVKTLEGRNKLYDWLTRVVLPAGDPDTTRLVVLGTLLHDDSIMMRLKRDMASGVREGAYREYPLLDEFGEALWKGKYPDAASIEALRKYVGNEKAFTQEYLLKAVSDHERVIHPEWLHRYTTLPPMNDDNRYRGAFIGMDLAIAEGQQADNTAMVCARVYGWGENTRIYILPNPINAKMDFPTARERAKALSLSLDIGRKATMFIEGNGYQRALAQDLEREHFPATAIIVHGDKRARLALESHRVKDGVVVFPDKGCETLIAQLTGFGSERHDDLSDAFALLVSQVVSANAGYSPFPEPHPMDKEIEMGEDDDFADMRPITADIGRELRHFRRTHGNGEIF
jgi:predicted phage terminase large subunit-like protein